jgi:lipopolysaccharide transport system permease protein
MKELKKNVSEEWNLVIRPHEGWFNLHLADLWRYRDLIYLFVRRDFVAVYKQTVLGPVWFFIQPLLTSLVFTLVFHRLAKLPTEGAPAMLFYLAGTTPWNYFAACLTKTSDTFIANANLFGKVYFPRLVTPVSVVISTLIQFVIQFLLFFGFLVYYLVIGADIETNWLTALPLSLGLLLIMGALGLGLGIIVSAGTTKYRDLRFLVGFGVQLAMYATPVIIPVSHIPERFHWVIYLNPMSAVIEAFRGVFLGTPFSIPALGYSVAFTAVILVLGIVLFNRVERTFMDTV